MRYSFLFSQSNAANCTPLLKMNEQEQRSREIQIKGKEVNSLSRFTNLVMYLSSWITWTRSQPAGGSLANELGEHAFLPLDEVVPRPHLGLGGHRVDTKHTMNIAIQLPVQKLNYFFNLFFNLLVLQVVVFSSAEDRSKSTGHFLPSMRLKLCKKSRYLSLQNNWFMSRKLLFSVKRLWP